MSAPFVLYLAVALAASSLGLLAFVNYRERKRTEHQLKVRQMSVAAETVEDMLNTLEGLSKFKPLFCTLSKELIRRYQDLHQFDPNANNVEVRIQRAEQLLETYQSKGNDRVINRICSSDQAIHKTERQLQEIIDTFVHMFNIKLIDDKELAPLMQELEYVQLAVEVISGVAQGHKLYNEGEFVDANSHYFHAQKLSMQSKTTHPNRQRLVEELGEIINRERLALSEDLMPETLYNPEQKPENNPGTTLEDGLGFEQPQH
ncbi:hypothetical protein [Pseudoteredinibacter isoporae]|uniref:Uncharacterized protein n=1 Tax=Pseudoteredinibacter isoporae TaxID=570281 RepID=A0A7X0JUB7_9GAMM|nr:hypothetical protein [Pseudoteredinibacter isoporae]MBB6521575.1 hypothetical protein [Pseudoteredinibacter isoporae]NHO87129.1 hypothetical protein [Pseudoteredinibacter isoporae]NIB22953.1 hypothetical protein [Pseudoteredinibacter isoporae]